MNAVNLAEIAAGLPQAWSSRALGTVGAACVKVLRMDEMPVREESHAAGEALLVLDGRLEMKVDGEPVSVRAGELFMMPARTPHTVLPGSRGTLVIVDVPQE
ncbi:cupin domain-containing protein [Embleya sp. NPDC008237]|uniref:cupin domain-containing protein n=1 Tax=Embleya sp. NPDC008237 TaxID=3363978 RepID=UPI0036EC54B7